LQKNGGVAVTSYDVAVTVTDTHPKWLFASHSSGVRENVSALHSFKAQTIGVAAVELLKESEKVSSVAPTARLPLENTWIV